MTAEKVRARGAAWHHQRMRRTVSALVFVASVGCGSHGATPPPTTRDTVALAPVTPPAGGPRAPAVGSPPSPPPLLPSPRLDLDANRPRWHLYDRGLVIPIATEGLRKYDQAYRSPWSPVRGAGTDASRTARGKATLTFPWLAEDGAGEVTVIVRGRGLGRARLAVDGARLPALVDAGDHLTTTIAAGRLAAGEHTLTVDGGAAAAWQTVELAPAGATACPPGQWSRVSLYTELPADAHLQAAPAGAAAVEVRVTDEAGVTTVAYAGPAAGLTAPIALPAAPDQVVRLDLVAPGGCARWDGAVVGVTAAPPAPPPPRQVDNVVLVVVDTLRADRLAAYGPTRVETPRLTAAAERGAVFLRHQSMAPSSPPSHATIHTGQIPRVHGIVGDDGTLGATTPILSAILSAAGFATSYAGNNDFAMSRFKQPGRWDTFTTPYYAHGKDCRPIVDEALARATAAHAAGRRFFISLLPIEPHVAYRFHDGVTDRYWPGPWPKPFAKKVTGAHLGRLRSMKLTADDWARLRALYDGEVTHVDACFGVLEDGLRAAGLLDATAIVVASDHGEGQGERGGRGGHAYSLNRELVATPLIIVGGVGPARVTVPTSNLDLAPTVLALVGLPPDPRMQGQSLVPVAAAAVAQPSVVASEYGRSYALRAGRWHLVADYDGRQHLYDVVADPDEEHDRAGDAALVVRYLRDAAGLYLAHRTAWHATTWGTLADLAPGNPLAAAALPSPP